MQAVTGVFSFRADAERAVGNLRSTGVPANKITLLIPENVKKELESVPVDAAEQPGMGKAVGAVGGAAAGLSGGSLVMAAVVPGVGPVTAVGLLGGAVLAAAGASVGAATGGSLENSTTEGLPEDEIFVSEDALRKGRSVVIALAEDVAAASSLRELLDAEGEKTLGARKH